VLVVFLVAAFGVLLGVAAHPLVHVNAALNLTATVLLVIGFLLIRSGREAAHKRAMLAAFFVSSAFLACYLWYHAQVGSVKFTATGAVRTVYLSMLASHIILAATVPFLAVLTIRSGYRSIGESPDQAALRRRHRRLAWWTFPIWLYVSITGVAVYVMLYHLYPPNAG
jgi:uncharacterized membrane protein YozB (DUF420 family)